jgi:hypothetical protein
MVARRRATTLRPDQMGSQLSESRPVDREGLWSGSAWFTGVIGAALGAVIAGYGATKYLAGGRDPSPMELVLSTHDAWMKDFDMVKKRINSLQGDKLLEFSLDSARMVASGNAPFPKELLDSGRNFVNAVLDVSGKAPADSSLREYVDARYLGQATEALWFVLLHDYFLGLKSKGESKPADLFEKDLETVYKRAVSFGLDNNFDYLVKFVNTVKTHPAKPKSPDYPFPEREFKLLSGSTQKAIGYRPPK